MRASPCYTTKGCSRRITPATTFRFCATTFICSVSTGPSPGIASHQRDLLAQCWSARRMRIAIGCTTRNKRFPRRGSPARLSPRLSRIRCAPKKQNNAWMAQLLLQGTNFMNFMGRYIYVATGKKGFEAIAVAEHDEPEAIYGSDLQRIAYPDNYKQFVDHHRQLRSAAEHSGNVLDIQTRGEYAYAAGGPGGLRVYDIANIDNKSFSEKITTAPVSPIGQRFLVPTKNAVAVVSPTTLGVDPLRRQLPENEEQPIHLLYGFLYVADKEEGLVIIGDPNLKSKSPGVGTLLDGNPANNFLKRALAFNPNGVLTGARRVTIAGTFAYILTDKSLVVVDLNNPLAPRVTAT